MGAGSSVVKEVQAATAEDLKAFSQSLPDGVRQKLQTALQRRSLTPGKLDSVAELICQLREKKTSSVDLVETCLVRIKATEELKACTHVYADEAKAQAKAVDEKIASGGALRALEGIPIVVKVNFDVAGTVTDASNPVLKDFIPNSTAPAIQKLIDAGAIVIAKTNMPVNARNFTCFSPIHGKCLNPVNLANTPAGSSSGTVAAIAAGIVSIGMGSDTGGSGRLPAICCGIPGFRPSPGRYSNEGCVPCVARCDTPAPIGTCVRDIMLMDSVCTGAKNELKEGSAVTDILKGLKIALPLDWIAPDKFLNKTVGVAWDASINALEGNGVAFVKEDIGESFMQGIAYFMGPNWDEMNGYLEKHRKSGVSHPALELSTPEFLAKSPLGEADKYKPPEEDPEKVKATLEKYDSGCKAALEYITGYFAKADVRFMLTPSYPCLPLNTEKAVFDGSSTVTGYRLVGKEMTDEEAAMGIMQGNMGCYAARWAGMLTSIAIPIPVNCQATGLCIGVILWGPKDSDEELLQAAAAIEAAFADIDSSKHVVSH